MQAINPLLFSSRRKTSIHLLFLIGLLISNSSAFAQPVLSLDDAIMMALEGNLGIKITKNDESIAQIQNNWGNAGRLPTVNATAGYSYSSNNLRQKLTNGTEIKRDGASFQNENVALVGQWRIFSGFRVVAAKERLEELEKIGSLQVRQQANQVVYNVISAYLNILRFRQQRQATEESIKLFEERMQLAQNRFNIGTAGKSDYLQAVVDLNQQKNLLLVIDNNILQSKTLLNNQLARNPDESFDVSDSLAKVILPAKAQLLASIDTLNPTLLVNRSQAIVLTKQQKEINALRLPTISLNAGGNLNNSNNSAGFTLRNTTFGPNAGITASIPIFQGGIVKQQLKVNAIQQKTQAINYQAVKNDLQTNLANAYNNYANAGAQYDLEIGNLEVVKENNMIAMERFRKASITTVELRQTQLNLIESQSRMINALYNMKQSETDVLLIVGKLVD